MANHVRKRDRTNCEVIKDSYENVHAPPNLKYFQRALSFWTANLIRYMRGPLKKQCPNASPYEKKLFTTVRIERALASHHNRLFQRRIAAGHRFHHLHAALDILKEYRSTWSPKKGSQSTKKWSPQPPFFFFAIESGTHSDPSAKDRLAPVDRSCRRRPTCLGWRRRPSVGAGPMESLEWSSWAHCHGSSSIRMFLSISIRPRPFQQSRPHFKCSMLVAFGVFDVFEDFFLFLLIFDLTFWHFFVCYLDDGL